MFYFEENGDIFVCGRGEYGQLGLGDNKHKQDITFLKNIPDLRNLFCGSHFTTIWTGKIKII